VALQAVQDPAIQSLLNELRLVTRRLLEIETDPSGESPPKPHPPPQPNGSSWTNDGNSWSPRSRAGPDRRQRAPGAGRDLSTCNASCLRARRWSNSCATSGTWARSGSSRITGDDHVAKSRSALVPLGKTEDIESQVRLYQRYVRRRVRATALIRVATAIGRQVWQPVEEALPDGTQTVIVSPDGELNFVSFAALLLPDDHFLAEKFTVRYVTSGRDLLEGPARRTPNRNLVIVANPVFSLKPTAGGADANRDQLTPLPGARKEVAYLMKQAAAGPRGNLADTANRPPRKP